MTDHVASADRQQQIAKALLGLLADQPLEAVTTRQIAQAVGLTQPALFRHFRSRDAIVQAALSQMRAEIGTLAQTILAQPLPAQGRLQALAGGLASHIELHPGLPRLLFRDVALLGPAQDRPLVQGLVSMLRALVAELVRGTQAEGQVPAEVDAAQSARLFVALLQGVLLQWQLDGRTQALKPQVELLLTFWLAGLRAGEPRAEVAPTPIAPPSPALVLLDVRPILQSGVDPLDAILAALARLPTDGLLKICVPFRPAPLLTLLGGKGLRALVLPTTAGLWEVEVLAPQAPDLVDLRDLEAPQPLEQVLLATSRLQAGQAAMFRVPRLPIALLPHLQARGIAHMTLQEWDGSALLHLRRPA